MSGARKLFEKFLECRDENITEVTLTDRNETKKFTRSKSGRYKMYRRSRSIINENTFVSNSATGDPELNQEVDECHNQDSEVHEGARPSPKKPSRSVSNVASLKEKFESRI